MVYVVDADHGHALNAVREVLTAHMAEATKIFSVINAEAPHTELSAFPLMVPGEEKGTVDVFDNIRTSEPENKQLPVIHYQSIPAILAQISAEITAAEEKHRQHKWMPERANASARKRVSLTLPKILTKVLSGHLKDDQIRDLAQRVEAELWPRDLVICKELTDYTTQFSVQCGGCMQVTDTGRSPWGHFDDKLSSEIFKAHGLWPSCLVAYCPNVHGVYFAKDGKPLARGFVWEDEKNPDGPWLFGYIRAVGGGVEGITKALTAAGYKSGGYNYFRFHKPFVVPGVESEGKYYIPMPNLDMLQKNFYVQRISETEVSVGGYEKPAGNSLLVRSSYDWRGWRDIQYIPYA